MTGYVRQEAANIVTAATIQASHLNNEANQIQAAFNASSGHTHAGGTGEGAKIPLATATTGTLTAANGGTGLTSITDGGLLLGSGTSAVTVTARPTDGQLLIGKTGSDPVLVTLTDGTFVTATEGSGTITLEAAVTLAGSFPTDSGTATPTANALTIAGGTGLSSVGSGTTVTINANSASTSAAGISELATSSEINTSTDTGRVISPGTLSDSNYGLSMFEFAIPTPTVADDVIFFVTPAEIAGQNIVDVRAQWSGTIGTGAATSIQLHNLTQTADVLSTNLTIDSAERSSTTAATPVVIDTGQDDITSGDVYQIDIDVIGSTVPGTELLVQVFTRVP